MSKIIYFILIFILVFTNINVKADNEAELAMAELALLELEDDKELNLLVEKAKNMEKLDNNTTVDSRYKTINFDSLNLTENQIKLGKTCQSLGITDNAQLANIFAQVEIESSFVPKSEIKQVSRNTRRQRYIQYLQSRYWQTGFYGRGLIQITWRNNYKKFADLLAVDLINNPELANNFDIASKIVCIGMKNGMFTRFKLDDCINEKTINYYCARRIVNGTDKAQLIHEKSQSWYNILTES